MDHSKCRPSLNEPIAIIGSGCRFAGAVNSPCELWDLLKEPRDVLQEIPRDRFDIRGFYHSNSQLPGHTNVKHSYVLDSDIGHFDAQFFNITPDEAIAMDPQQRLLLETVYEGLESAGLTIEGLRGSDTGVYVGVMWVEYEPLLLLDLQHIPTYSAIGSARSIASNRISYFFDWHGPSITLDTACSSSLVALHQAVQALRSGEVRVAVTAGTNLLIGPESYIQESKLNMLSPDGRSRMWDQDANGYARGDGVAAVVLKTLSAAMADGDNIECIIRETGVNQDGRSRGITMPRASAQAALIRDTYTRAGLNSTLESDRCQFFEAHGTGTPAGDPVEAESIHSAFFGDCHAEQDQISQSPLLVGSIKTIIGHTEGTAGLAGIIKVVQSMKHGYVPPNMHLGHLNPAIAPFYKYLRIPQRLTPWPEPPPGQPRRASVNSFGFGGTNAHVILEGVEGLYNASPRHQIGAQISHKLLTPFLFTAQSKQSLLANMHAYINYLDSHPRTSPSDLAWTLRARRSRLPLRVGFPGSSIDLLRARLSEFVNDFKLSPRSAVVETGQAQILGIFTGQGAQWPQMGTELIETSGYAASLLEQMDEALSQLPEPDRPCWTLRDELLMKPSLSNINTAAISQPLCTAVQIILVELLHSAGIEFTAVVGHSSGEIAAAFAAGYLSIREAICIAYYRGLHCHLASGPDGAQGAMIAVGTSLEEAEEICNDEKFKGRVMVAACNSPSSVTISGNKDAVADIHVILEDKGRFSRQLKVEKAYHSHHMVPCSQPYLKSLKSLSVESRRKITCCSWFSSVNGQLMQNTTNVHPSYWVENLVSPVLFDQAVRCAMSSGSFHGAVEVGPHPSLKGPFHEILRTMEIEIPYTSLLQRNTDSIHSISNAFGYLWAQVDNVSIDFDQYERMMGGPTSYSFIPDLPLYQWNHSQRYWHVSPTSKKFRQRNHPVHPLLGDMSPQSSPQQLIWKNILRLQDLPWIKDHQLQGQAVFPAAGYVSTALATVDFLAAEDPIQLVEIEHFMIYQALVFDDSQNSSIAVRSIISNIHREPNSITTQFKYESWDNKKEEFNLTASCEICVRLGEQVPGLLPATQRDESNMLDVPIDTFYAAMKDVGYDYTGPFRALSKTKRKLGLASGLITMTVDSTIDTLFAIHPGALDAAFHSIILAFSYPRDGQLWSLHLPTGIRRIRANPALCGRHWTDSNNAHYVATVTSDITRQDTGFEGDVEIHDNTSEYSAIQVEGLRAVPFTAATKSDDKHFFHSIDWVDTEPNADVPGYTVTAEEKELAIALERGSLFYLRQLGDQIPHDHPGRCDRTSAAYLNFASHNLKLCFEGKHRYAKKEWLNDTLEDIVSITERFSEKPEVKAMHVVGQNMHRAIFGETNMLEHLMMDGLLDDYYKRGLAMPQGTSVLADTVLQIARRHPHARLLEVGAGTGGATRQILDREGSESLIYTFTDVSAGFFPNAKSEFVPYQDRMTYRILDLERDLQLQGFGRHTYDIVVASLVLHATKDLEQTLGRVRTLLKPGGYLIVYEITNVDLLRLTAVFGCLPGWWLGIEEGRTLGAPMTEIGWDTILRKTGFSGIDSMTTTQDTLILPMSVFVSQAVDEWLEFIREPISGPPIPRSTLKSLFIIGGSTFRVFRLIENLLRIIKESFQNVIHIEALEDFDHTKIESNSTILVLADLDQPVFKDLTPLRFQGLKKLFGANNTIVWVTQGRMINNPFGNMPLGFARSAHWEVPGMHYQFVDFEDIRKIDPKKLAEIVLRFQKTVWIQSQENSILWPVESEIIIKSDGRQLVPRLTALQDANDRYNSARRTITKAVQLQHSSVVLSCMEGKFILQEPSTPCLEEIPIPASDVLSLNVTHSGLRAVKTGLGDTFVVMGTCQKDGTEYIGLADSTSSRVLIPKYHTASCSVMPQSKALFLTLVTTNILLPVIEARLYGSGTVVVHGASVLMRTLLSRHLRAAGISLIHTSTSRVEAERYHLVHIDQYSRKKELQSRFPDNISHCIDFTPPEVKDTHMSLLKICLPTGTPIFDMQSNFLDKANFALSPGCVGVLALLEKAVESSLADLQIWQDDHTLVRKVKIEDISAGKYLYDGLTVVEWDTKTISTVVRPVKVGFKANRTYWLAGLSKDMGLSIASWMIQNGAKHLVVSSRNPKVDRAWLDQMKQWGANVQIMSCDLADYTSVKKAYLEICGKLPEIAGVAQGAMVLNDVSIDDMNLEAFTQATGPKVEGSLNLDSVLENTPLDFFIFFGSVATIMGNHGQANYTAANLFMTGLASARRRRGLAASVIELALVTGAGYVTRELGDVFTQSSFENGIMSISERDVHQTFAEAIIAGDPQFRGSWQLTTGLRQLSDSALNRPQWHKFPQFACLTIRDPINQTMGLPGRAREPIKDQLANALTKADIKNIIKENCLAELRKLLHVGDDYDINPSACTDELGIDSLIAVRIRSWFLTHFQVNVPAMKLVGGAPLRDIIDQAVRNVPNELTPQMSDLDGEMDTQPEQSITSKDSFTSATENGLTPPSSGTQSEDELSVPPRQKFPQSSAIPAASPQ